MAITKNFGISGIGSDVQLGKAGGRFQYAGGVFQITGADGTTLTNMRSALPVNPNDVANKAYVDSLSSGLDPKESVRVATTGPIDLSTFGLGVIDGVTVADGDRVLVKNQSLATENGIYIASAGAWTRASDMDGSPTTEVSGGNFTFVEQGTANINSGWVVQGNGVLTVGTDPIAWVQFSGAGQIQSGAGIKKTGNLLEVDLFDTDSQGPLPVFAGTAEGADLLLFGDDDQGTTHSISVDKLFNDMDVVKGITANGFITRTADDVYASREIAVNGQGALGGLAIVDGGGLAGNPTIGLDIANVDFYDVTNPTTPVFDADSQLVMYSPTELKNVKASVNDIILETNIVQSNTGSNGLLRTSGTDQYTSIAIIPSTTLGQEGITVDMGLTYDQDIVVGFDVNSLGNASSVVDTDLLLIRTIDGNRNVSALDLKTYAQSGLSQNSIQQGDSSVTVTDAGAGTIAISADNGTAEITVTSGLTQFSGDVRLAGATEIDNGVLYVLADGTIETTTGFTFDGTNLAVPGSVTAGSFVDTSLTQDAMLVANASGEIVSQANVLFSAGVLSVAGAVEATGDITTTTGNLSVSAGNATVSGSVTAGSFIDTSLTQDALLTVSGTGEIVSSGMTVAAGGEVLNIGNIRIDGTDATGNVISSTDVANGAVTIAAAPGSNGNIILAPDGTGEVVIGNAGTSTQIVAEDQTSLTVAGGASASATAAGDLNLFGGDNSSTGTGGNVVVQAGTSASGTSGVTQLLDANDNVVAQVVNSPAATDGTLDLVAGATIAASGTAVDVNIVLDPKGNGTVVVADAAAYDAAVVNASLVTKAYVDAQVAANVTPGSVGSITATIDLATAGAQAVGTIPANATVLRTYVRVTAASATDVLVNVGDATNGASSYMTDAEVDTTFAGVYTADSFVTNAGVDVTANATVSSPAAGTAVVIVEYRNA